MEGQNKIIGLATHISPLARTFEISRGDVLELGAGYFSTTLLRWLCEMTGRTLYSYEPDNFWYQKWAEKPAPFHQIFKIKDWDEAKIERSWGMAFVDHSPDSRRWVEIKRLANFAEYIVIHNSDSSQEKQYGYDKIWNLFKYRFDFTKYRPATSVVSNFHNLEHIL